MKVYFFLLIFVMGAGFSTSYAADQNPLSPIPPSVKKSYIVTLNPARSLERLVSKIEERGFTVVQKFAIFAVVVVEGSGPTQDLENIKGVLSVRINGTVSTCGDELR